MTRRRRHGKSMAAAAPRALGDSHAEREYGSVEGRTRGILQNGTNSKPPRGRFFG